MGKMLTPFSMCLFVHDSQTLRGKWFILGTNISNTGGLSNMRGVLASDRLFSFDNRKWRCPMCGTSLFDVLKAKNIHGLHLIFQMLLTLTYLLVIQIKVMTKRLKVSNMFVQRAMCLCKGHLEDITSNIKGFSLRN